MRHAHDGTHPDANQRILELVARGEASSRSQLAEALGMAPSTVGLRVQALIDAGALHEGGPGASRGGRRPRELRVSQGRGEVLTVDLGGGHARLGRHALGGALIETRTIP
ncbi:winged helix-turn-helix transcriptional regulator [Tessaracoccus sp. HDW20]|uniref:winged helix-turn-helix domain-containing protein n=1 Tax=Tessaracoccus coleopterorum TaxID=2714950 RepID=UPI0018D3C9B8|nr:winged helix-turn-helix domain-containing protein [Tessaracoccus coleopterorum]NHB85517.1 winged helix-turn-helix transcriptional regulator [Tessaracoccus coleopterorum]